MELWALEKFTLNLDPRIALAHSEVSLLLYFKLLTEKLPDGFSNTAKKCSFDLVLPPWKMLQTNFLSLHSNLSTLFDSDHVTLDETKSSFNWS